MQHPRRPKRLHQRRLISGLKPAARRGQGRSHPRRKTAQTAFAYLTEHQLGRGPRPQIAAQKCEEERRIRQNAPHITGMGRAVAGGQRLPCGDVGGLIGGADQGLTIRAQHRCGVWAVAILHPMRRQIRSERRPGGRGHEQDPGRRHHIMGKARRGRLFGAQRAAKAVVALQHQHAPTLFGQHRRRNQPVDPGPDDDVVKGHAAP